MQCRDDRDCPGTLICFTNVSWHLPEQPGSESFCSCASIFGWVGDDCQDFGPATVMTIVTDSILVAGFLLLIVISWNDIIIAHLTAGKALYKEKTVTALIFMIGFACVFGCIYTVFQLWLVLSPKKYIYSSTHHPEEKSFPKIINILFQVSVFLMSVFTMMSALHVSIIWLKTVSKTKMETILPYRTFTICLEIAYIISQAVPLVLGLYGLAAMLAASFVIVLLFHTMYARVKIVKVIEAAGRLAGEHVSNSPQSARSQRTDVSLSKSPNMMVHGIKKCSNIIAVSCFLLVVASVFLFVLGGPVVYSGGWRETITYGQIGVYHVAALIVDVCLFVITCAILEYSHNNASNFIERSLSKPKIPAGGAETQTDASELESVFF